MDSIKQNEEKLREACCYGDIEAVIALVNRGANINSKHEINGWTGLHWATKRGNLETVKWLLVNGANAKIANNQGQTAAQLTTNPQILQVLDAENDSSESKGSSTSSTESLPITPNYLAHPPIDPKVPVNVVSPATKNQNNGMAEVNGYPNATASPVNNTPATMNPAYSSTQDISRQNKEIVLKIRIAHTDDPDFIEVDLQPLQLTYSHLLITCCNELAVNPQMVEKIRKLPNTRLRNDKDVKRLTNLTEIELVIKGHSRPPAPGGEIPATAKNNYASISSFKNQTILY